VQVLSNETISQIQTRIETIISMKKESQKWYLDGKEILNTNNETF
jgi:hypothetical protein